MVAVSGNGGGLPVAVTSGIHERHSRALVSTATRAQRATSGRGPCRNYTDYDTDRYIDRFTDRLHRPFTPTVTPTVYTDRVHRPCTPTVTPYCSHRRVADLQEVGRVGDDRVEVIQFFNRAAVLIDRKDVDPLNAAEATSE